MFFKYTTDSLYYSTIIVPVFRISIFVQKLFIRQQYFHCFRCSTATQTEDERKLTETSSTQTDGLSFDADGIVNRLDDFRSFRVYVQRETGHFARYIKYLRGFKF